MSYLFASLILVFRKFAYQLNIRESHGNDKAERIIFQAANNDGFSLIYTIFYMWYDML